MASGGLLCDADEDSAPRKDDARRSDDRRYDDRRRHDDRAGTDGGPDALRSRCMYSRFDFVLDSDITT